MRVPRLARLAAVSSALVLGGCATVAPAPVEVSDASSTSRPSGPGTGSGTGASESSPVATGEVRPSATPGPTTSPTAVAPTPTRPELPGGGRTLLPAYRLVGFAGVPGSVGMGRLGIGELDDRAEEIVRIARPYADGRKVMPVLELIATVVQARAGRDGMYRSRVSSSVVDDHLAAARKVDGMLLLNIQPGRADFLTEVRSYERWLKEPDVGIALDPEWAMGPGQIPMEVFGHTTGREIDGVAAYLAGLVNEHDLPEKPLVFHQLAPSIVTDEKAIRTHPGVIVIKSVDGIGSPGAKISTFRKLTSPMPATVRAGFKLFYQEDAKFGPIMTPQQVLALRPKPDYVLYE